MEHVSKLLQELYNKNKISNDNINHQKLYKRNFWKYCKTIFEPKSDKVLPNFSKSDCQQYCERALEKGKKNNFRIPSWIKTLKEPS